ncbi:MAG: M48 family metalloprotease [Ignavibacteriae bacterium]|nr:M48 family metalloprotease [Ignavibacteriota bacterium]
MPSMQEQILEKFKLEFPKSYYFIYPKLKKIIYNEESNEIVFSKILNESKLVHDLITTNVKINIFKYHDKETFANIFTIPGAINEKLLSDNSLSNSINLTKNLMNMKLKMFKKENKIFLISNINNVLLPIFVNHVPFKLLTFEERFSIYLHEIGHWVNYKTYLPSQLLFMINTLSRNYILIPSLILLYTLTNDITIPFIVILFFFITTVLLNVMYIINEFDSDKIVKDMGYGFQFSNALNKIEYLNLEIKNKKSVIDISKKIKILFSLIHPILLSVESTHPDSKTRVQLLMSESLNENLNLLYDNFNNRYVNNLRTDLMYENIDYNNVLNLFEEVIPELDNFIYLNHKQVFKF